MPIFFSFFLCPKARNLTNIAQHLLSVERDHTSLFVWCIFSGTPVSYSRAAELQRWPNTCLPKLLQFIICCLVNLLGLGCDLWPSRSTNGWPWHVCSSQKELCVSTSWKSFGSLGPNTNRPNWKYLLLRLDLTCWCWGKLLGGLIFISSSLHFQPLKSQSLPGLVHLSEEICPLQLRFI